MTNNVTLSRLPQGWVWTKLGDIAETITGTTPPKNNSSNYGAFIPFVKLPELRDCVVYTAEDNLSETGAKLARILPPNSVLVSCIGNLGKTGLNGIPVAFNQQINAVIFPSGIVPKYGFYYLQTASKMLKELSSATTVAIVNKSKFNTVIFPLPPLPEQRRIVAKIEELFTRLDAGAEALKKIQFQLKRYRQSVLKSAFSGELTAEWRKAHKGELEPASVLLAKIKEQRKKSSKYKELPPLDAFDLPELPEEWVWARVGDISDSVDKVSPQTKPEEEFFYLDISSIDNHKQKVVNPKRYLGNEAPSRAKQLVRVGDILFSTVRTYLRNIAVVDEIYNGQIASTGFCVIRPSCFAATKFIFYWVQADSFLTPLAELQRGTSYPAVRDSDVFTRPIPLLSLGEQQYIAEEIERCLSVADEIETSIGQSLKQAERLRQSILKKAFEGNLVPQNPDDEPAEKLLERIRAERTKVKK